MFVRKVRAWLVGPSVLIGLVMTTELRHTLSAEVTVVGSSSAAVHHTSANDVACFDTSPHKTTFVTYQAQLVREMQRFLSGK